MKLVKGIKKDPWIILIYGVPGVGKSTLATFAPQPVFLNLENGLARVDCTKTDHIRTWQDFVTAMQWAKTCEFKTIVVDTAFSVEEFLVKQILDEVNSKINNGKKVESINDKDHFPYGAGSQLLKNKWAFVMQNLVYSLRDASKNVILIAHEQIQRVSNPEGEDYDRYSPNINKKSLEYVTSQLDGIFFCHYEKLLRTKKGPMGKEEKFMQDTGNRLIQCQEKTTALAKSRFRELKPIMPFNNLENAKGFFHGIT